MKVRITRHAIQRCAERFLPGEQVSEIKTFLRWCVYNSRELTRAERLGRRRKPHPYQYVQRTTDVTIDGKQILLVICQDRCDPEAICIVTCLWIITKRDRKAAPRTQRYGRRDRRL